MSRDISLNESASSPSWSRERIGITWPKSPCAQPLRADRELVDAARDLAREQEAEGEGDGVHHEEHETDDAEREEEDVRERAPVADALRQLGSEPAHEVERLEAEHQRHEALARRLAGRPVALCRQRDEDEARVAGDAHPLLALLVLDRRALLRAHPPAHPVLAGLDLRHLELVRRQDVDPGPALEVGEEPRVGRDVDEERRVTPRLHDPQHGGAGP